MKNPLASLLRPVLGYLGGLTRISAAPSRQPVDRSLSREQFRELLSETLEDPVTARLVARRLLLPVFPMAGGACATTAATIGSSDFGSQCNPADTGNYTFAGGGKVGIGIGAPLTILDARGTRRIASTNYQQVAALFSTDALGADVGAGLTLGGVYTGASVTEFAQIVGAKANATAGNFGGELLFHTRVHGGGFAERMRIDTTGNVGIGTPSPWGKLTVLPGSDAEYFTVGLANNSKANIVLQTLTAGQAGFSALNFNGYHNSGEQRFDTGKNRWRIGVDQRSTSDYLFMDTYNGTGLSTTILTATTAGNLGIEKSLILGGGATPTTKQVSGGPELISFQHSAFNHVAFACFVGDDDDFQFGASMHGFMEWGPGDADQDVALFRNWAGGLAVQSFNGTTSDHAFSVQKPTSDGSVGADLFRVNTVSNTVLAFGNVGIGESSPDYKLDVNGALGFTPGSSVTPVDNGDVVFELTNNTTLTVRAKGSDGTVRSGTIALS